MSDQITYDNKVDLQVATNIANINKVTASDMNEIKSVVNGNATATETELTRLETDKLNIADVLNQASTDTDKPYSADYLNDKLVSVGTTAPTDGRRVWFEKGKNLFDGQLELGMYDETGAKATNNANYRNVAPINVQPSTTYTFSINGTSQKYVIYLYKKDGTFIRVNTLTSGTFTTPAEAYLLNFRCFNADFTSDYANLKIQLEQGSNATSYEPYIEQSIKVDNEDFVSMSDLVSVGANQPTDGRRVWFAKSKNLFTSNALPDGTTIGITKTFDNSEIKLSGTSTSGAEVLLQTSLGITLPAGTYTMSYIKKSGSVTLPTGGDLALYLRKLGATTNLVTHTVREINGSTRSTTFTLTEATTLSYYMYCNKSGVVLNDFAIQVQIEEGSNATSYEPYVKPAIYVDGVKIYEMS